MTTMFAESGLTKLNVTGWDRSNLELLRGTFADTSGLTELDLSSWDNAEGMHNVFVSVPLRSLTVGRDFVFGQGTELRELTEIEKWLDIDANSATARCSGNTAEFTASSHETGWVGGTFIVAVESSLSVNGTGTSYAPGTPFNLPSGGATLFAQWKAEGAPERTLVPPEAVALAPAQDLTETTNELYTTAEHAHRPLSVQRATSRTL